MEVSIPNEIYEKVLLEIIENNLPKSIDDYDLKFSPGSNKGDNYLGIVYRIRVIDKSTNESKLNLILKLPPQNPVRRQEMTITNFFTREAKFYDDIYPLYKKFQEDKGINIEKDGFCHVPLCYKTLTDEPNEGLFLEDLKALGYEMYDRLRDLTKEHVFLVMKTLGRLHAVFFAIKDQKPELVETFYDMKDAFILMCERENSPMIPWFESLKEQTLEVVNKSDNPEMIERVKRFLKPDLQELLQTCLNLDSMGPYAAICHGDCWNNNILFKNVENGAPYDLKLLDFQMTRYASPVCDLAYYIFCCTTKDLRDKHFNDFLDVYYQELSSLMIRLGSSPEELFPRHILDQHFKLFGKFGLLMAMIVIPIFTSDANDAPDMDDLSENFQKLRESGEVNKEAFNHVTDKTYDKYYERMMGICNDLFSLGYI